MDEELHELCFDRGYAEGRDEAIKGQMKLLEAVADIAYAAGHAGFTTDDSREDVQLFIQWAQEFETTFDERGQDYMESIDDFVAKKMNEAEPLEAQS